MMNKQAFQDKQTEYTEKAQHLLNQMSLQEKVALMSGRYSILQLLYDTAILQHYNRFPAEAGGNPRLNIPAMKFCDGPRGVVTGKSTCFPVTMQRGASFDVDLERRVGEVIGKEVRAQGGKNIEEAKQLATQSDAVVVVVGLTHSDEGEFINLVVKTIGGDRRQLGLHINDVVLIQQLASQNKRMVVVLVGSNAIMMEAWKNSVPCILHSFYSGMEGGTALARLLFGEVNPSGKLPFSIPTDEKHLPTFDSNANEVTYDLYHGYSKLEKENHMPAFAFGFGLSYSSFVLSGVQFSQTDDELIATATLQNTGQRDGAEVVQLYVGFENSKIDRPKKLLCGFSKVMLKAGESQQIRLTCSLESLRWYNSNTRQWEMENMPYQVYLGTSSRAEDLKVK
jgi:beta-glucosidase